MDFMQEYEKWLHSPALSPEEHAELESIKDDPKEIESRFFGPLEFGTAGLRGTMYTGLHNMNIHVIRWATQGFADVIAAEGEEGKRRGVAICMDCRNHSMEFARAAAEVCAANGIHVRIFDSLRPTPELSFAVREYGCQAGINVTASHNPKEYNGYKVYWSDGAQLPPHHADAIAKRLEEIDIFDGVKRMDFDDAVKSGLIETMGDETDRKFMANVTAMINDRETVAKVADTFKLVYTPFHGCGYKLVPEALTALGIKHLIPVPEQMVIDGNFPTVVSPNPENPEGFYLAIDLAKKNDVDFILGTDPDSDRVGIMVRNHEGEFQPVTGNQTGVLLLDYLIGAMKRSGKMPANPVALKTIVTTEMARKVAESNGVKCFDTFTGFKFMAEKKNALEESGEGKVIFSYEESYGYMLGDYVRDKDAVTASMLLTEMAAWYDAQGMTLFDALNALYEKYGWYAEKTHNLVMPGLDGLRDMAKLMKDLRENPPTEISGVKVIVRKDYTDGSVIDCVTGAKSRMELSGSNVLRYELEDGTVILVRPSGTEPKIKVYILTQGADAAASNANLEKYEVGVALAAIYEFTWDVFCDWYIELAKARLNEKESEGNRICQQVITYVLNGILKLLHPFMPFITEELYQALPGSAETIMTQAWPTFDAAHNWAAEEEAFEKVMDYIKAVRTMRTEMNVHPAKKTSMIIETADAAPFQNAQVYLAKFAFATDVAFTEKYEGSTDGMVQVSTHAARGFIPMMELIDREKELARLNKEKTKAEKEMAMFGNQLNNPKFVERAPAALVEEIRAKFAKSQDKLANIEQSIKALG